MFGDDIFFFYDGHDDDIKINDIKDKLDDIIEIVEDISDELDDDFDDYLDDDLDDYLDNYLEADLDDYEEPKIKSVRPEKPKEKCIIKRFLNLIYKNEN